MGRYRYRLNGKPGKLILGTYQALTLKNTHQTPYGGGTGGDGTVPGKAEANCQGGGGLNHSCGFRQAVFREIQAKDRKDNTIPRRYMDTEILPFIGDKSMRDLTTEDVRSIIWRKKEHGFDARRGRFAAY